MRVRCLPGWEGPGAHVSAHSLCPLCVMKVVTLDPTWHGGACREHSLLRGVLSVSGMPGTRTDAGITWSRSLGLSLYSTFNMKSFLLLVTVLTFSES